MRIEEERLDFLAKQREIEEKAHAARLEEIRVAEEARLNALRLQLETDRVEAEKAMAQQQRELEEQRQRLLETGRQHQQAQELAAKEAAAALQAEALRIAHETQQLQHQQQLQRAELENQRLVDEQQKQRLLLDERDEALRAVTARLSQDKADEMDRRRHDAEMVAVLERTRAEALMSIERARQDTAGAILPPPPSPPLSINNPFTSVYWILIS